MSTLVIIPRRIKRIKTASASANSAGRTLECDRNWARITRKGFSDAIFDSLSMEMAETLDIFMDRFNSENHAEMWRERDLRMTSTALFD